MTEHTLIVLKNSRFSVELYAYSRYVDAVWIHKGHTWGFGALHEAFVEWVQGGFNVSCEACYTNRKVILTFAQTQTLTNETDCSHVEFPAGDKEKAHNLATVIQMGLV